MLGLEQTQSIGKNMATKPRCSLRNRNPYHKYLIVLGIYMISLVLPNVVEAQQGTNLPNLGYYTSFVDYYRADYKDAGKNFARGSSTAYRVGDQRYLDSVCYWTMMGECYYQMGNNEEAIKLYDQALRLYLAYAQAGWQARVQVPQAIQADRAAVQKANITWGQSKRQFQVLKSPGSIPVMFGDLGAVDRAMAQGGQIANPELKPVDITEIMRCTALALHRRRMIMGPTCKYSGLTNELVAGLSAGGVGGSMLGCYNGILLGIAHASAEDWNAAASSIGGSLQMNGGLDHPLTPIGLTELAQIGLQTGKDRVAAQMALEASFSAAIFEQYDLIEESLSIGTKAHLSLVKTPYPPLPNAIQWSLRNKARLAASSLIVRLAECHSEAGDAATSAQMLSEARRPMKGTSLNNSEVAARLQYVSAVNQFLTGNSADGFETLNNALSIYQKSNKWLFQLGVAEQLVVGGGIGPRGADLLYGSLLRDPTDNEWNLDPMDAIAMLSSNHLGALERWFEIIVERRAYDRAVEVSELLRRHRFFSTLPLGGRLMGIRWVMHAPEEALSDDAKLQRKEFIQANPKYKQLMGEAERIRIALLALPVKPEKDTDELKQQTKLFVSLSKISNTQESVLASFALRRQPAELAFPPQRDMAKFRKSFPEKQVALISVYAGGGYHIFKLDSSENVYVKKHSAKELNKSIDKLLKEMGVLGASADANQLVESSWKKTGKEIGNVLMGGGSTDMWDGFQQLVVIPDGPLWYLPFEALPIGEEGKVLRDVVDVRYAPTLFLAFDNKRKYRPVRRHAAVSARLHPKGEIEWTQESISKLKDAIADSASFEEKINIPTNFLGSVLDQMIVWSDIRMPSRGGVYGIEPAQLDRGRPGANLGSWLRLPWQGPEHIVIPGFNSACSSGIRKADGTDMFLTSCALMASGSRSILLSRWRTGGENSLHLTREFATRIPNERGVVALRQSIDSAKEKVIDLKKEPRMKSAKLEKPLSADHPFFWAANMLIEIPRADREADAVEPNAKADAPKDDGEKAGGDKGAENILPEVAPKLEDPAPEGGGEAEPAGGNSEPAGGGN